MQMDLKTGLYKLFELKFSTFSQLQKILKPTGQVLYGLWNKKMCTHFMQWADYTSKKKIKGLMLLISIFKVLYFLMFIILYLFGYIGKLLNSRP